MSRTIQAVLFDLDGTLVDSAPDLLAALAWLRRSHGLPALDYPALRHHASRGALGIIEAGFADCPELDRQALRQAFVERYAERYWVESRAFDGIEALLVTLQTAGLGLAVVTNKLWRLAAPLVAAAGWEDIFACVIGGDTTAQPKPHPAPVLEACRRLGIHPGNAIMVGDDVRDIEAGRQAGCLTAAATWGYIAPGQDPRQWPVNHHLAQPKDLHLILNEIRNV
ncbi:MAG: HAD family hydrolase [Wenzhouxiangella sp.]